MKAHIKAEPLLGPAGIELLRTDKWQRWLMQHEGNFELANWLAQEDARLGDLTVAHVRDFLSVAQEPRAVAKALGDFAYWLIRDGFADDGLEEQITAVLVFCTEYLQTSIGRYGRSIVVFE